MSKKAELKALRRKVEMLEAEVAELKRRPTTWTLPGVPTQLEPRQWWQSPWVCTMTGGIGYIPKVARSGATLPTEGGKTYTYN